MDDWRTIETFDKSKENWGEVVLFSYGQEVYAGWYDGNFTPYPWRFLDDTAEVYTGCCNAEEEGRIAPNAFPDTAPPFKWMPLPAPPKEPEQ